MRRRQATQRVLFGEEIDVSLAEKGDHRHSFPERHRRRHFVDKSSIIRTGALASAISLVMLWMRLLPLPMQSSRIVRNATVRFLTSSSSPTIRSSSIGSNIVFTIPSTAHESLIPADRILSKSDILRHFGRPRFNGLVMKPLAEHAIARAIDAHDNVRYETERGSYLADIDEEDERERVLHFEDYAPEHRECRRNNWRDRQFPNCQVFHETSVLDRSRSEHIMQDFDIQYTGHGYFRDSWVYRHAGDGFVLKKMRMINALDYDEDYLYQIHREAIVMERLTASPSIVNIYGHCATSILSEPMLHEVTNDIVPNSKEDEVNAGYMNQTDLDKLQVDDVRPMNNLTNEQKLDIAIAMAESIAEIHGYEGGVIIHGDIHPFQWLANENGQIKLNDFNNGEILEFSVEKQDYCKIYRCYGGTYRSPEEFRCMDSNEGMDTYSMGNNIYILLTGLWPFYQYDASDSEFIQDLLIHNKEKPYVDPRYRNRSIIEAGLVKAMEKAWEWDLDKRESIFEMIRQLYALRATVKGDVAF